MTLAPIDTGDAAAIVVTVEMIIFTVLYAWRSKPWKSWPHNRVGVVFLGLCVTFTVFLVQLSITYITDSAYPWREIIRPIAYWLGAVGLAPMIAILLIEQNRDRKGRK